MEQTPFYYCHHERTNNTWHHLSGDAVISVKFPEIVGNKTHHIELVTTMKAVDDMRNYYGKKSKWAVKKRYQAVFIETKQRMKFEVSTKARMMSTETTNCIIEYVILREILLGQKIDLISKKQRIYNLEIERMNKSKNKCATCNIGKKEKKLLKCSGCKKIKYCSKSCQKRDWKSRHRAFSKLINLGFDF
eukprot:44070_1